jgi:hypothetical protein
VPNVARLKSVRNLQTNEVSEVFELEYFRVDKNGQSTGETLWTELGNPEMPNEFLQEFITHASSELVKYQASGLQGINPFDRTLFYKETIEHVEYALELMWQELARRANGVKT